MCIKSDFKEIVFQPATNGQSDKTFLLTGAIYMYKITEKMCIESDLFFLFAKSNQISLFCLHGLLLYK